VYQEKRMIRYYFT